MRNKNGSPLPIYKKSWRNIMINKRLGRIDTNFLSNPFSQKTVISYQLPVKSKVSLGIYDVSGRVVKTLVNGNKEPGYYTANWDAQGLPAGIYFAKFCAKGTSAPGGVAGDYSSTKKLILVR